MKREIKFRAWDKDAEVMIYSDEDHPDYWFETSPFRVGFIAGETGGSTFEAPEPIVEYIEDLMQYTGLKDRNGKEIFESDVLNKKTTFEDNMADKRFQISTQINVGFEQGCFINKNDRRSLFDAMRTISSFGIKVWTDYEIIGNELENPELL